MEQEKLWNKILDRLPEAGLRELASIDENNLSEKEILKILAKYNIDSTIVKEGKDE